MRFIEDMRIRRRLGIAFGTLLFLLVLIEAVGLYSEATVSKVLKEIVHDNVEKLDMVHQMSEQVHIVSRVMRTVTLLQEDAAIQRELGKIEAARKKYDETSDALDKLPASETGLEIRKRIKAARGTARPVNNEVIDLALAHKDAEALSTLLQKAAPATERWQAALDESIEFQEASNKKDFASAEATSRKIFWIDVVLYATTLAMTLFLGFAITRSLTKPMNTLTDTMGKIAQGDTQARTQMQMKGELGELGRTFDKMMDEREAVNAKIKKENEQLNESVLALLQGVTKFAQRDLTSRVAVAEDVTGAVADALNLMSAETAKVLSQVNDVAREVSEVSGQVKHQSDSVLGMSRSGRREVQEAAQELTAASLQMQEVAKLAQSCNEAAQDAIGTTRTALESLGATGDSIGTIRDTVRETEKRIKRLGERSQEITGVVTLINTISERTHILALNAAMHAASAGEAGRGFAVVAGEVQRLAENAREATSQISSLVHNIQVETADTVNKMNDVITQVVQGGKLAEQAGQQMRDTEEKTNHLVRMVGQIATSSTEQARATEAVRSRTERVEKSSEITGNELEQQAKNTDTLVAFAKQLVDSVSVFRLPAAEAKRAA